MRCVQTLRCFKLKLHKRPLAMADRTEKGENYSKSQGKIQSENTRSWINSSMCDKLVMWCSWKTIFTKSSTWPWHCPGSLTLTAFADPRVCPLGVNLSASISNGQNVVHCLLVEPCRKIITAKSFKMFLEVQRGGVIDSVQELPFPAHRSLRIEPWETKIIWRVTSSNGC